MIVARELALIALPQSVNWEDDTGAAYRVDFERAKVGLFCNGGESALYILPTDKARSVPMPRGRKTEKKAFRTFTGFDTSSALEFSIPNNRTELYKVGYATSIEYESDKWTGQPVLYVHDYTTRVRLYADRRKFETARVWGLLSCTGKKLLSKRGLIA